MIEVATGLSDVEQQVDDEGPPDSEKHANLTVYTIACMAMVSLWPFMTSTSNWESGLALIFIQPSIWNAFEKTFDPSNVLKWHSNAIANVLH